MILLALFVFYWLPFLVASTRHHPDRWAIMWANGFFGWTVLGWLIAFIWAFTGKPGNGSVKCKD